MVHWVKEHLEYKKNKYRQKNMCAKRKIYRFVQMYVNKYVIIKIKHELFYKGGQTY